MLFRGGHFVSVLEAGVSGKNYRPFTGQLLTILYQLGHLGLRYGETWSCLLETYDMLYIFLIVFPRQFFFYSNRRLHFQFFNCNHGLVFMCKSGEKITDTENANGVEENIIEPISAGMLSII